MSFLPDLPRCQNPDWAVCRHLPFKYSRLISQWSLQVGGHESNYNIPHLPSASTFSSQGRYTSQLLSSARPLPAGEQVQPAFIISSDLSSLMIG